MPILTPNPRKSGTGGEVKAKNNNNNAKGANTRNVVKNNNKIKQKPQAKPQRAQVKQMNGNANAVKRTIVTPTNVISADHNKHYIGVEPDASNRLYWRRVIPDKTGKLHHYTETNYAVPLVSRLDQWAFVGYDTPVAANHPKHVFALSINLQSSFLPRDFLYNPNQLGKTHKEAADTLLNLAEEATNAYLQRLTASLYGDSPKLPSVLTHVIATDLCPIAEEFKSS